MKPGFTLLELIIALALGGLIGAALFTSLFQFNKGTVSADQLISIDSKAVLVQHQIDRDLSGMFTPYFFAKKKGEDTKKTEIAKNEKTKDKKQSSQKKDKTKKKELDPLENAFVIQQKDGMVTLFSFITSNPIAVYGTFTPRIVRVVYRLVPERVARDGKQSFALYRQELQELKFTPEDEAKAQGVLMVDGVKSLKIEFEARVVEEEPKAEGKQSETKGAPKITYEASDFWGPEQIKKFKKQLPNFVKTKWSFWDGAKRKSRTFSFLSVVVADDIPPPLPKEKPKKADKGKKKAKSAKKGGKPGGLKLPGRKRVGMKQGLGSAIPMFAAGLALNATKADKKLVIVEQKDYCEVSG